MSLTTDYPLSTYVLGSVALLSFLYSLFDARSLRHIPTIGGPAFPVLSYLGAYKYIFHTRKLLQEGYDKYKGGVFKIALLDRWLVIITGTKLVDELQKAPDDYVSFMEGSGELVGAKYIFGEEVLSDHYNVTILRERLTRNLTNFYPDIHEEISQAFEDLIPAQEHWVSRPALQTMREIVSRTGSRIFVGYPLCRDEGYLKLSTEVAEYAAKAEAFISLFPPMLKPLAAWMTIDFESRVKKAQVFVQPMIDDRLQHMELDPEWPDKPNDFLQWLIDGTVSRGKPIDFVVRHLLSTNFVAIDTSSNTFTHVLYHLAANPEYAQPLREEVEEVLKEEGWSRNAVSRMYKIDSFIRESLRYNGIESISLMRMAVKDFSFSDGTFIPKGTIMSVPTTSTHRDEEYLSNAQSFDPWRYSNLRGEEKANTKYQLINPSNDYIAFGLGKHACPGRFFAANELKTMLAYIVMHYDVKLEKEGERPENLEIALAIIPNYSANVLFRKRSKA